MHMAARLDPLRDQGVCGRGFGFARCILRADLVNNEALCSLHTFHGLRDNVPEEGKRLDPEVEAAGDLRVEQGRIGGGRDQVDREGSGWRHVAPAPPV